MSTEDLVYNLVGNKEPLKIKKREREGETVSCQRYAFWSLNMMS